MALGLMYLFDINFDTNNKLTFGGKQAEAGDLTVEIRWG